MSESSQYSNTLGNASLGLGVISTASVFCIGITALAGVQGGWLPVAGLPLWICGATSAFLGLLAIILGGIGVFTAAGRNRAIAVTGAVLGILGICLFIGVIASLGG